MRTILIDMTKYREYFTENRGGKVPEGTLAGTPEADGLKPVRELSVFLYACRCCKDAPCVTVCPQDALRKNDKGMISRSTNRCVACKSCVAICPFGTMMNDFYEYRRNKALWFNLKDEKERIRFIRESPSGVVQETDMTEDAENNIYELSPGVLIKDYSWEKLKNEPAG
jgi:Fe-S-cluster-containing dehydrogenase component